MEKNKKVLHIIPVLNHSGVSSVVLGQLNIAKETGYDFDFLHHGKEEKFHKKLELDGSKIYRIQTIGKIGILKYFYEISKIIKKNKYEIVHVHTNYQAGLIVFFLKLLKIPKRIVHVHGDYIGNKKIELIFPILKKLINNFSTDRIAVSEKSGNYYFYKNNYKLILNSIDIEEFQKINEEKLFEIKKELNFQKERINILQIGRLSKEKNHKFTLRILKKLKDKKINFCCYFVGDGEMKDELIQLVKTYRLEPSVKFVGNRNDVNYLIKLSTTVLLPSISEGFPMTALEVQAMGKKIIISDNVTSKVDIGLGLVEFNSLDNIESWIKSIIEINIKNKELLKITNLMIKSNFKEKKLDLKSIFNKISSLYRIGEL